MFGSFIRRETRVGRRNMLMLLVVVENAVFVSGLILLTIITRLIALHLFGLSMRIYCLIVMIIVGPRRCCVWRDDGYLAYNGIQYYSVRSFTPVSLRCPSEPVSLRHICTPIHNSKPPGTSLVNT